MILYAVAGATLIMLLWGGSRLKVCYLKSLVIPAAGIAFILLLMLFSKAAVEAASKGIYLWLDVVFPALFPFFVASEILQKTSFIRILGLAFEPVMRPLFKVPGVGSFAFAMGIISGYPMGAKITTELRKSGMITKTEGERLIAFTNNSGPLFIVGAVAVGMFKQPALGFIFLSSHIAACVSVGLLFKFYRGDPIEKTNRKRHDFITKKRMKQSPSAASDNFGGMLGEAIRNAVTLMLAIGGFIIFFSVIIRLLLDTGVLRGLAGLISLPASCVGIGRDTVEALLGGAFEITTGCSMVSTIGTVPFIQQAAAVSMIIGWAGLSVHSQVASIVSGTDIGMKPYFWGKFLQGVISAFYTCILIVLSGYNAADTGAFMHGTMVVPNITVNGFALSGIYIAALLVLFTAFAIIFLAAKAVKMRR